MLKLRTFTAGQTFSQAIHVDRSPQQPLPRSPVEDSVPTHKFLPQQLRKYHRVLSMPVQHNYYPNLLATEKLDKWHWGLSDRSEPEPNYPHNSHDLSRLSQYFINATAFTPNSSMGTGEHPSYGDDKDIAKAYKAISESLTASTSLFRSRTEIVEFITLDYDCIGILFEYGDDYFVIMQSPQEHTADSRIIINRGWLEKRRVGMHLICECECLPKERSGKHCIGATGDTTGWWKLHSKKIMDLRVATTLRARLLEKERQKLDPVPSEERFKGALRAHLSNLVDVTYEKARNQKQAHEVRLAKEAKSAMRKFTAFEEVEEDN